MAGWREEVEGLSAARAHGCGHRHGGGFGGEGAERHYPPNLELEPTHLKIRIALDLAAQTADLVVATTIACRQDGVRRLVLDGIAFEDLKAKDAAGGPLRFSYDSRKIEVIWDKPFALGETRVLETAYRVVKPSSGLFFMKPTPEDPSRALFAATDHETELARYWLSCIDLPNVRTTLEFEITADERLTILANGALLKEEVTGDGRKTAYWRLEQRCPSYLVCFAVGDFVRHEDGDFEGIPLAYFACRDFSQEDLARSFGKTKAMLQWMTRRLGVTFPFPKYFQFALPNFGGAMENISLVSWSDSFVVDQGHAPEEQWHVDQVNVHEMAHSYFGDLVVCRDFAHAWLKESWATYMETCWLEDAKGGDEQFYDLYRNAEHYFEEADDRYSRPLVTRKFTSSWQMYDRHLYPGGACRLHTLRKEVGDEVFWRAVTDYLRTYAGQVVETDDFRRKLEQHCGRSLQKFFDQWVFTAAYPHLKVTFRYDAEKRLGTFEVEQKQVDDKQGIPAFELSTDVAWQCDGELHVRPVKIEATRQSFQFPMPKEPTLVRFDPQWKILHKLDFDPGEAKLKCQLAAAKDIPGRIHAAKKLCESGTRAGVEAVAAAYGKEPFWGVRREMAKALADARTEDAVTALAQIVASERDPLVLGSVFASAGSVRDPRLAAALTARVRSPQGLGPRVLAEAYLALGNQREAAPVELLRQAAETSEPRYGTAQAAALNALGRTRREEVAPFLLAASHPGKTHYRARQGAVSGLAHLAASLERGRRRPLEERLIDLLRDPDPTIRRTAAGALRTARVRDAVQALESYRATLPLQEQVRVDGDLASLRSDEDARVKGLEKQIDELQAKLRKLGDRLQDLEDKARLNPTDPRGPRNPTDRTDPMIDPTGG